MSSDGWPDTYGENVFLGGEVREQHPDGISVKVLSSSQYGLERESERGHNVKTVWRHNSR